MVIPKIPAEVTKGCYNKENKQMETEISSQITHLQRKRAATVSSFSGVLCKTSHAEKRLNDRPFALFQ